jgi:serpin B
MRQVVALALCVVLAAGTTACTQVRKATTGVDVAVAAELPAKGAVKQERSPVAAADLAFGLDLFARMRADAQTPNLAVSPLSVSSALAMTANGANGETRAQMEKVLRIEGLGRDKANQAYADLIKTLAEGRGDTLTVANALWADDQLELREDFIARDRDYFGAQLTRMPFEDPAKVVAEVNGWVAQQTHDKIPKLLDESAVNKNTVMELVDAVYFKGKWKDPFEASETTMKPFTPGDPKEFGVKPRPEVPTMRRTGTMPYIETPEFQAVRLDYEGDSAMYVFLPSIGTGLPQFAPSLTAEQFAQLRFKFQEREGTLELPKFTFRTKDELSKPLAAMGMPLAFQLGQADFTGIGTHPGGPLFISRVDHSVFIAVDEKGTEAAAATSVGVQAGSAMAPVTKPFVMKVDRPFFFAIVHEPTGEPLFIGTVTDPSAK